MSRKKYSVEPPVTARGAAEPHKLKKEDSTPSPATNLPTKTSDTPTNEELNNILNPHLPLFPIVESAISLLGALRYIRDSGEFTKDGSHTFREWCMKQFGEK